MWPFKTKKTAQDTWDILRDAPDPNALDKVIRAIETGDTEAQERLFKKIINDKMREIERNIHKT